MKDSRASLGYRTWAEEKSGGFGEIMLWIMY